MTTGLLCGKICILRGVPNPRSTGTIYSHHWKNARGRRSKRRWTKWKIENRDETKTVVFVFSWKLLFAFSQKYLLANIFKNYENIPEVSWTKSKTCKPHVKQRGTVFVKKYFDDSRFSRQFDKKFTVFARKNLVIFAKTLRKCKYFCKNVAKFSNFREILRGTFVSTLGGSTMLDLSMVVQKRGKILLHLQ
jgi:hypothetical protein